MNLAEISVIPLLIALILAVVLHCWKARRPLVRLSIYIRIVLGFIMLSAGFSKIAHQMGVNFGSVIGPVWLEEKLAPHGLALFGRFIACAQIVIGLCLLLSRFTTLGAIMLLPMLLCIWVVTISMNFHNTPYVVAAMLLMNGVLLARDWPKLKFIFAERDDDLRPQRVPFRFRIADIFGFTGAAILLAAVLIFHLWPQQGPRTVKLGLLLLLASGFSWIRSQRPN